MIAIKNTPKRNIDDLALLHSEKLENSIREVIGQKYLQGPSDGIDDKQNDFLINNLKDILSEKPAGLLQLYNQWQHLFESNSLKKQNQARNVLNDIFDYEKFSNKNNIDYNAYNLAIMLEVNVCPYCNINFTHTVVNGHEKYIRPDFDHFYIRSKYPLLALSFYNLIPCCSICNSRLKGSADFFKKPHFHPYTDNCSNKLKFITKHYSVNSVYGIDNRKLEIYSEILDSATNEEIEKLNNSIRTFKIEERLNLYLEYVSEIMAKYYHTNGTYLESLMHTFQTANFSKEELYRIAFANFHENDGFDKRPLSKLLSDVINSLSFHIQNDD